MLLEFVVCHVYIDTWVPVYGMISVKLRAERLTDILLNAEH